MPQTRAVTSRSFDGIGYSLYLRSFADSNGDGVGDLRGVIDHLDHLQALGVDLVWITPFYLSPMVDGGYDVTDHCAVDPRFGSLDDVDELLETAHSLGLAVIVDLVANHTSSEHPWFRAALTGRGDPHRDRYVWADPADDGGPPNNWVSYFGGSAWAFDEASGQYYLHLFLPEQPDLNWRNPCVHAEYDRILRFWLARGVDGFRVDVAQGLVKDECLRSNPQRAPLHPDLDRIGQWSAFDHRHDILQPESIDIFRRWKQLCDAYGAVLIGEVSVGDAEAFAAAVGRGGLDVGMWLETMHVPWDAPSLRAVLATPIERLRGAGVVGWQSSSLDEPRAVTRFGGGELGRERALALTALLVFLPGLSFIYQGDELGLEQGAIDSDHRVDPVGLDAASSRDGCRTPMPWTDGAMAGFTDSTSTWLPLTTDAAARSVSVQQFDGQSMLSRHRALLASRRSVTIDPEAPLEWVEFADPEVIGFRRANVMVVLNTATTPVVMDIDGVVIFDSLGHTVECGSGSRTEVRPAGSILEGTQAIVVCS